ncbi:tRNA pseudouridine(13) synthase TruD, partial [Candidatus Woesearchaeota archaeon]|nr:tRNA pseudouridine(13) synthase TruD [Candidatus Woesearchaeota archaeon]
KGKERIEKLQIKDVTLEFVGYRNEPITLGKLEGNYFEIVVRDLDDVDIEIPKKIANYFGEQRFGQNNVEVGRNIIKKDFAGACKVLRLEVKKNNFVGALKEIPKRLLKMYVHAYQSWMWNETVKEVVDREIKVKEVPLLGFGTDLEDFPKIRDILEKVLEKEKLKWRDFIVKQIPELSLEGELRKVFVEMKDFKVLEKEKKKVKIAFTLPKGSYATIVIKEVFTSHV